MAFYKILFFSTFLFSLLSCSSEENLNSSNGSSSSAGKIVIYSTLNTFGNFGASRSDADNLCFNSRPTNMELKKVKAYISLSSNDEIRDMAENYGINSDLPVLSNNGTTLALNWSNFARGPLVTSLQSAGVALDSSFWWSGTNNNGSYDDSASCNGWSSDNDNYTGAAGSTDETENYLLAFDAPCDFSFQIICVAY